MSEANDVFLNTLSDFASGTVKHINKLKADRDNLLEAMQALKTYIESHCKSCQVSEGGKCLACYTLAIKNTVNQAIQQAEREK